MLVVGVNVDNADNLKVIGEMILSVFSSTRGEGQSL
jgi:hypothetical protein